MPSNSDRSFRHENPIVALGSDLAKRRKVLALTQLEVAELAAVSDRFVRSLEQGKQTVQLDAVVRVCDALGLELILQRRGE